MKKKYFVNPVLTLLFTAFIFIQANAQIRIVQVNPATETVTIHNYGSATIDIATYWLCTKITYQQLNLMTLQSGDLDLAPNTDVTVTATTINLDNTAADLGLYDAFNFTSTTAMLDFTQWGASFSDSFGRENVAVAKGIWTAGTFISVAAPYEYTGDGSQNGVTFWSTVLGVGDFENKIVFNISPNPVTSILNIQLSKNIIDGNIKVFDILGKQILTIELNPNNLTRINVSNLSKGMYLVKITSGENTQTKRFIKE